MPNLSFADAAGRPVVDGPADRSTFYYQQLLRRGLIVVRGDVADLHQPDAFLEVPGTVFVTAAFEGYFHWHNDVLPHLPYIFELQRALASGPVRLVSTWPLTEWRRRSLALLGIPAEDYVHVAPGQPIRADGMLIALRRPSTQPPRRTAEAFDAMCSALGIRSTGGDRLYISRSDAAVRRVTNEQALEPALKRLGFRRVTLGGLTYDEKMRLFSQASICLGPHGAGFSHIGFMPPGSLVLEMITGGAKWMKRGFIPRMAAVLGHRYGYVCFPEASGPTLDFEVPPEQIIPDLEALLAGGGEGA